MLSILIHTLGCKLNLLESEAFADAFTQAGFSLYTPKIGAHPSVILINTCTVTSKADQKARRVIRKTLRDYPDSFVLVTGCYAQLNQIELAGLEESQSGRFFVIKGINKEGILDLPRYINETNLSAALERWNKNILTKKNTKDETGAFQFSPEQFSSHTRSFLKIQDGCDNHCTYCRIRLARGPSISLDSGNVLSRLRILEKTHAEAVLTGVNISQYSDSSCNNFGDLLDYVLEGTSKIHLRLSSLAPDSIDENLAKILANKRIRPHFHLSIQSGSKKILEKMGRSYTSELIEKAVGLLRDSKEDPFLACDIITGFPGETETDFNLTIELCKKIGFAWIHVFPYSKRPGTQAFSFSDTVQEKEVSKRVQILTELAWQGRAEYINRWLGREVEVLVENGKTSKSGCRGVSENYLKLLVHHNVDTPILPGTTLLCRLLPEQKINRSNDYDAVALKLR